MVLAAGAGTRLLPITRVAPKALCPVGGRPLVDLAVDRLDGLVDEVWVNVHHGRERLEPHLDALRTPSGRGVGTSVEADEALGTAGALGHLRDRLEGRAVLVVNADGWSPEPPAALLDGWDGERVRVLVPGGGPFGPTAEVAGCLLPWSEVERLEARPTGLYEVCWRPAQEAGRLEVVGTEAPFVDCGTPTRYLGANLAASAGATVVGEGVRLRGHAERSVLWDGVTVAEGEVLDRAIRASDRVTVLVR